MPVTARLSRKFYETFGDEIANELVDWFNRVDATYRADLRALNELNFQRFDAKLEQRLARQDAKSDRRIAELETKLEHRLAELDVKWAERFSALESSVERRLAELDAKWTERFSALESSVEQRLAELDANWAGRATALEAKIVAVETNLMRCLAAQKSELLRWTFVFWVGTLLPLAGLLLTMGGVR